MAERRIKKDITYIDPSKKGALLLSKNRKIQLTRLKPKNADDGFNILIRSTLGDVTNQLLCFYFKLKVLEIEDYTLPL